jgi:hypothetical protein
MARLLPRHADPAEKQQAEDLQTLIKSLEAKVDELSRLVRHTGGSADDGADH